MKLRLIFLLMIISALGIGCKGEESIDQGSYVDQINALNEEVIKYLDDLEEKNKIINDLEKTIEKKSEVIKELETDIKELNKELSKIETNYIELENKKNIEVNEMESLTKKDEEVESVTEFEKNYKDLTTVVFEKFTFALLDEEEKIPFEIIGFNNIIEEKILSPLNGNQYTYSKRLSRDGIIINTFSNKDEDFKISSIFIESPEFKLKSGFGVGANESEIEKIIKEHKIDSSIYDDGIYKSYNINIDDLTSIYFEIEKNIISSIKIEFSY